MCLRGPLSPGERMRWLKRLRCCRECSWRSMNGEMRPVEAPKLLGPRMHMYKPHLRPRDINQRIGLRGQLTQAAPDEQQQIGLFDPRHQLWIGADAEISRVAGMQRIEEWQAPVA